MTVEQSDVDRVIKQCPQSIINAVCPGCPLFETKQGNEPPEIRQSLQDALEVERLMGLGFVPSFTEVLNGALSIQQIAALEGLKTGRDLAERERTKDQKKQIQQTQKRNQSQSKSSSRSVESFE